jgi:hypothetical protein
MFRERGSTEGGPPPVEGGVRTFNMAVHPAGPGQEGQVEHFGVAGGGPDFEWHSAEEGGNAQKESLGSQVIEGVQADGTRTTVTIPAGRIGNDKPIQIVTERWFSNQLQAVVLSKRSDPRVGQTIYRLTNVTQAEPAAALFQVPSEYTIQEGPALHRHENLRRPNPNANPDSMPNAKQ